MSRDTCRSPNAWTISIKGHSVRQLLFRARAQVLNMSILLDSHRNICVYGVWTLLLARTAYIHTV